MFPIVPTIEAIDNRIILTIANPGLFLINSYCPKYESFSSLLPLLSRQLETF
jgi:hypothetical protein